MVAFSRGYLRVGGVYKWKIFQTVCDFKVWILFEGDSCCYSVSLLPRNQRSSMLFLLIHIVDTFIILYDVVLNTSSFVYYVDYMSFILKMNLKLVMESNGCKRLKF